MPGFPPSSLRRATLVILLASLRVLGFTSVSIAETPARKVDFNREIRPLLSKKCFSCHGSDENHREAGLRLDSRVAATSRLASGARAIVPGEPDASEMIGRITAVARDERMPPADAGEPLSRAETQLFRRWIEQGAAYAEHWSFRQLEPQVLPDVANPSWPANGIDFFIQARLEREGLTPAPRANRYALIRRLSLDLRGLPPSPAEVDAYISDSSVDAYERMVDRFLADPAFGERWARVWLDLARYADSQGYQDDGPRTIWPYRDWVVQAFNDNLPFDQFTVDQIAGDLLPGHTLEQLIATAFNRNTMTNTEGGTDDEEFRVAAVEDRVDTTMEVWMGLTMACAKCHSHKYDPITQREYYQFFAFFNQTADADAADEKPTIDVGSPVELARGREIDARISTIDQQLAKVPGFEERKMLREQLNQQLRLRAACPSVPIMQELPTEKRRKSHVLLKGNFLAPGEVVTDAVPQSLHPLPAGASADRLGMARWLIDKRNPLTARVAVNRFWGQVFGAGLVETPEDFGTQGAPPSHPELLDWLAMEFMRLSWDQKAVLRLMVTSETYRQSARVTDDLLERDPRNRLLARSSRYRLDGEVVRDQALALSGLLSHKMFGRSVFPPQPASAWTRTTGDLGTEWVTSSGEDRYRRSLYTFWRRSMPYPSMATFDAPSREVCTVSRVRTNTPLQAFVTLNDPVFVEAAQALARRVVLEGGPTKEERVGYALKLCLAREPTKQQTEVMVSLFNSEFEHFRNARKAAVAMAASILGPLPHGLDPAELAAWTAVSSAILNLDAVLTRS